tara:strand:- start:24 stop:332 length:309 start_codon:yes stop_codon:yes gene_type:complete
MWATPAAADSVGTTGGGQGKSLRTDVKMFPTPAYANYKGAAKNRFMGSPTYRGNLDEAVRENHHSGQLSADWVEWLMGYPAGWTSLETPLEQSKALKDEPTD